MMMMVCGVLFVGKKTKTKKKEKEEEEEEEKGLLIFEFVVNADLCATTVYNICSPITPTLRGWDKIP